ncbi:UvrD-helicase domain-containing protein [Jannaschia sp. R86511]|uniref:UvrD-helicase domain-containing protein n=1 Tax=Jannaschia sp. R86511 TaxID=3093853 RepID=UPI0036D22F24
MTIDDTARAAGASQRTEAQACRERAEEYARLQQLELDLAVRHEVAGRGEASVAATLSALSVYGWKVLVDRQWPRSAANIDMVLVGPGGVVVVDAKTWAEPRVENGRLLRGDSDETDSLDALRSSTAPLVADLLAETGYAASGVVVAAVLAGRSLRPVRVSGAVVVGERDVATWVVKRGHRIDPAHVDELHRLLAEAFPPHQPSVRRASTTAILRPRPRPVAETADLFDVTALAEADLTAAARGPIEAWMTWLHPDQSPVVGRTFNGPARLSGPAGTGKTVIALHRAAAAARLPGSRVLVTTFVSTLPVVLGELIGRLAPEHADRVEARSLHSWALALLRERGVRHHLDGAAAERAFGRAWATVGRQGALARLPVIPPYWQEEIDHVIKGRGIDAFEDYVTVDRVGRRTPLRLEHREAVWDLYCAYQDLLAQAGRHDFSDVLRLARDELRRSPLEQPYTAVVVDEVQDLTMVGVQLLHALVGDRTNGLLLVGDTTQALYPGGFRLREAGLAVVGRSVRLGTNYRNGAVILDHVATLQATAVDLDEETSDAGGSGPGSASRQGGRVHLVEAPSEAALEQSLLQRLGDSVRAGTRAGDCAVLVPSNAAVTRWVSLLGGAGLPALRLDAYRGAAVDAVKVGTVHRAKGLEFGHVVVTDSAAVPPRRSAESEDAYAERAEGWRRQVHVAMTRARDTLWCGQVVGPRSTR